MNEDSNNMIVVKLLLQSGVLEKQIDKATISIILILNSVS